MNIPDEGFFTLLTQGMRNRTVARPLPHLT